MLSDTLRRFSVKAPTCCVYNTNELNRVLLRTFLILVCSKIFLLCLLDTNECLEDNLCDTFADCINTEGSYTCKCKDGYTGNGQECTKGKVASKKT